MGAPLDPQGRTRAGVPNAAARRRHFRSHHLLIAFWRSPLSAASTIRRKIVSTPHSGRFAWWVKYNSYSSDSFFVGGGFFSSEHPHRPTQGQAPMKSECHLVLCIANDRPFCHPYGRPTREEERVPSPYNDLCGDDRAGHTSTDLQSSSC